MMGRTMKFESPSRLSKFKKTMTSSEGSSKLSLRDWRKTRGKSSVEMELLTELPVPTVPPYPIEFFEEAENGLSHVNMAFKFSEEFLPSSFAREDRFHPSAFKPVTREEATDNDSKGSSNEDSRDSVGGSTVDSGVVLRSDESRRTSGNSNDFRTSPDGRAEKEPSAEQTESTTLTNGLLNNGRGDHYPRSLTIDYPTYPLRPGQSLSRPPGGSTHPISNGTLLHSAEHINKQQIQRTTSSEPAHGNYQDLRGRVPVPVHRPPVRVASMPPHIKEHIYVNRPPVPAPPLDDSGPPPYPGASHFQWHEGFRPPPLTRAEPMQPLPHLGSQIRSQLWQTSAAPRPCGRSKSVHDEYRRADNFRSRLGSINTLGIPYQTTLPARLARKSPPSGNIRPPPNILTHQTKVDIPKKADLILSVPINKIKVAAQPGSPFKKSLTPVYSKVCKQKKLKKPSSSASDSSNTKLLSSSKGPSQSYSTITPRPAASSKPSNEAQSSMVDTTVTQLPQPVTLQPRREEGTAGEDGYSSPLYEELLHLHQDEQDEDENGQYSIEVRIDYSKGTKYKVEKRRRNPLLSEPVNDNNNNTESSAVAADRGADVRVNNLRNDTSVTSDRLKQFRRDKKESICGKLRSNSDVKNLKESVTGRFRMLTSCCCGNVKRYVHQPGRIEDYIPGFSSLSEKELRANPEVEFKIEAKGQDPPRGSSNHRYNPQRMQMSHALKETGYESDSTLVFRKQSERRPEHRDVSELYRQIQRGGEVPLEGLRKAAPRKPKDSPFKYETSEVNIHYKTPVRLEQKDHIPDEELAMRQEEHMRRVYEQERRKKYLAELEDIERRRHTDNFTPLQKSSPIPLNRYDDDPLGSRGGKQVARALFNFNAQNKRELSFSKGDIISVRRQIDKNWHEGELKGLVGIFPSNYVEILPAESFKSSSRKPSEGQARARFAFQAQTAMEMSFFKGETVVLTRRVDENWYEGRVGQQRRGIFPVSYVDVLVEPGDKGVSPSCSPLPRPALPASNVLYNGVPSTNSAYSILSGGAATQATSIETRATYSQQLSVNTQQDTVPYRALYNYKPQNEDELELSEGDIVMVMEKCDDGWYVGTSRRTSLFGTFPGNYVERVA